MIRRSILPKGLMRGSVCGPKKDLFLGFCPGLHRLFGQELSKGNKALQVTRDHGFDKESDQGKGSADFYQKVDLLVCRNVIPLTSDPHSLNPHPRDVNDVEFRHMLIYDQLSPQKYKRLMNKQMGIDEYEVVVDPETFKFRDVFRNHFKNINEPIPPQDWFLIWSFYFLAGYLLWISLKQLGRAVRKPYIQAKKQEMTEADKVERKRIEEERVSSDMVMKSRSPQAFYRYDFGLASREVQDRMDEIDRLFKDPKPVVGKK
jgi:hypothetical protein